MTKPYCIGSDDWNGLSKIIEECGELGEFLPEAILSKSIARLQILNGKLIGSEGDTDHWSCDLRAKLMEELPDLQAAIAFFQIENFTQEELDEMFSRYTMKLDRFMYWDEQTRAGEEQTDFAKEERERAQAA